MSASSVHNLVAPVDAQQAKLDGRLRAENLHLPPLAAKRVPLGI